MNKETLRMQMLAGVITESQYKQKLNEETSSSVKELAAKLKTLFPNENIEISPMEGTSDEDMELIINDSIFIVEGAYQAWDAMVDEEEESFQSDEELIEFLQGYFA